MNASLLTMLAATAVPPPPARTPRFEQLEGIVRKYAARYRLDYQLIMAQAFQESGLDQNARSAAGAIGVMQVMPATGEEMNTGDISQLEPNVHAGVKYVRYLLDHYFERLPTDAVNKTLFAFAAYNAGPGRIAQLRALAQERGLDPNVWVGNVETVAAATIGDETVRYVSRIHQRYLAWKRRPVQPPGEIRGW